MHMLLIRTCNPALSLRDSLSQWGEIAARLREGPRLRKYQCEIEWNDC